MNNKNNNGKKGFARGKSIANSKCERLYRMLDDIDTLSDAIKPSNVDGYEMYMKAVTELAAKRHLLYYTDGFEVFDRVDVE